METRTATTALPPPRPPAQTTADQVLAALLPYGLKQESSGRYRCNSPLRPGSNSLGFTLRITGPEHGAWYDHVAGRSGSLYALATVLGVPQPSTKAPRRRLVVTYDYVDGAGRLLYQVCRYEPGKGGKPKDFVQRQPDGAGGWRWDMQGARYVLYHLPAVLRATDASETVYIVEGEKDADRLEICGLTATCNVGGAGKWRPEYAQALQGADVVIIPDNDATGEQHKDQVVAALAGLAARIRVVALPGLVAHGDVSDWLDAGHTIAELKQLVDAALPLAEQAAPPIGATAPPSSASASIGSSGNAAIDVTNENLGAATDAIWAAMRASPYGPNLFAYGNTVAYLEGQKLATIDETRWRGMVNRAARFTKQGKAGETEVIPPIAMVRDSLCFTPPDLPAIDRLASMPVFSAAGALLTNGYHPDSRTLVLTDIDPAPMAPEAALSLLMGDLLVDFPFSSQADRANALGYLLLPFVREMCGAVPLFLLDAAQRGTGKTLLNDLIHIVWTGEPAPLSDLPLNEEEQRKSLTTHLMRGPTSIVFDDVSLLQGHALQRAVTGQVWVDRLLGANKEISVPIRAIWAASGNNVTLAGDMVRRTVLIRLESAEENPSQRSGFKRSESELRAWVREHRAQLVSACVALVAHGLQHGKPGGAVLGGFDQFARLMGRILDGIGVQGFLGNMPAVMAREDGRQSGWKSIIRRWWHQYGNEGIKAGAVADLIEAADDSDLTIDGDSPRARAISVGKLLKAKIGAVWAYEDTRLRLDTRKNLKGDALYCLSEINAIPHQEALAEVAEVAEVEQAPAHGGARAHAHGTARADAISATSATSASASESHEPPELPAGYSGPTYAAGSWWVAPPGREGQPHPTREAAVTWAAQHAKESRP